MNTNGLVSTILRTVLRRLVGLGVNAGIDLAATRGKAPAEMTREERRQAKATARRARQMMRITRRFMR